jgi:hypothetical protein
LACLQQPEIEFHPAEQSDRLLPGYLNSQTKELLALLRGKSREHSVAVFDVRISEPDGQPLSSRGEFDSNYAPVVWRTVPFDQSEFLQTVESGGDCRDWCRQGYGDLADSPRLRSGQNLEEADIVRVKARIDTSGQQTRLDTEIAHERANALMQGKGVPILDGATCR